MRGGIALDEMLDEINNKREERKREKRVTKITQVLER